MDVSDCLRIDVDRINHSGSANALRRSDTEPSRPRANIGNSFSLGDAKYVHHAVDLKSIFAPRGVENGEISGVGIARRALRHRRRGRWSGALRRCAYNTREEQQHEHDNAKFEHWNLETESSFKNRLPGRLLVSVDAT